MDIQMRIAAEGLACLIDCQAYFSLKFFEKIPIKDYKFSDRYAVTSILVIGPICSLGLSNQMSSVANPLFLRSG